MELTITMPHPPRAASPNGGHGHWRAAWRAKKIMRQHAHLAMLDRMREAGALPSTFAPTTYRIRYYYKGTPRDVDNILAGCKAYLDGCADAFRVNDRVFRCAGIEPIHALRDPRCGTVEITFSDTDPTSDSMKPTKRKNYKHPHAALIWYWDGARWHIDAALARTQAEVRCCIELMTQRAATRTTADVHIAATYMETRQLAGGMLTQAARMPTCMDDLRKSTLFRATLRALVPWLELALLDAAPLHYGTWADRQKGGAQ